MRPKKLSGGLLRRLNIACGIAHKPRLIILDEPTVAVDPQSRNINDADFETVPVAVVKEEHADYVFLAFLDQIKNGEDQLLAPEEMTEEQARTQLEEKEVSGIYYVGSEPTLTVASSGIEESILQSVLQSYENTRSTVRNMLYTHPEGMLNGLKAMMQ